MIWFAFSCWWQCYGWIWGGSIEVGAAIGAMGEISKGFGAFEKVDGGYNEGRLRAGDFGDQRG